MNLKKTAAGLSILLLSFFLTAFSFLDIRLSSMAQRQRLHEIIKVLQPKLDEGKKLTSFQLYLLAGSYNGIRNYSKALSTADLLQKRIDDGDRTFVASDLTVYPQILRGSIYLDQGEPRKAIQEGNLAFKLFHEAGRDKSGFNEAQLIDIYNILGIANAVIGNAAEARQIAGSLQELKISLMNGPPKYCSLARIYVALKEYDRALDAVSHPDAKVTGLTTLFYDQTFQEIPNLFILAKSLFETGKTSQAKKCYDQLLGHQQIDQIGSVYWIVLLDRARIARQEGQKKIAEEMLRKAVEVIENGRSSIQTEAGRIGFVGDKQRAYAELIELLLADGRVSEAFAYVERAKARALVDLLASQKNMTERGGQSDSVKAVLAKLDKAENDLTVVAQAEDREEKSKTRSVVLALKKDLQEKAPRLAALVTVTTPSSGEIQRNVRDGETLLEYYYTGRDWYVFVLTNKNVAALKLLAPDLEKNVNALRKSITNKNLPDFHQISRTLYSQLFAAAAPSLKTTQLIIVPHGVLHYLPFAALNDGAEYLVDRFTMRMLPSASVLGLFNERAQNERSGVLILGNPKLGDPKFDLKFAEDEALAVGEIVPKSNILLRGDASKSNLQKLGGGYSIIHLAAHGVFDLDNPLNSALLLAPDADNDGRLRVGDLYDLFLNADLVTLSACETALGKVATGDDVVGFTRGFLFAGARSLVSSLWQVDDKATRDLMVDFYANLSKMTKDEALRQAQIKIRRQHPHPFFWAAFLLTGSST